MYTSIACSAMETMWNRTPNDFQSEVIPFILQMIAKDITPQPILLVQPTGSGKSSVPQTSSVVSSCVSFIVECTQSLGSDQASKMNPSSTSNGCLVYAYQLDLYKNNSE